MSGLAAIVVAAGSSTRMDGVDKIWAPLAGGPILAYSVTAMAAVADELVIVVKSTDEVRVVQLVQAAGIQIPWRTTRGGAKRHDSVRSGLHALRVGESVAIHDAARPLATSRLLERVWSASRESGAAIPAIPIHDTVKRVDDHRVVETVDRSALWTVQTPQVFSTKVLVDAYRDLTDDEMLLTDDAGLVERTGRTVQVVMGEPWNLKITGPGDVERAEALLPIRESAAREDLR